MSVVRDKARKCLARRQNAENLSALLVLTIIEIAVSLELHYWIIAIIVTLVIFSREGTLIVLYAEEAEHEVELAVSRARELWEAAEEVPVPVRE